MIRMGDGAGNGGVDKDDFMELMRELGLWGRNQDQNPDDPEVNGTGFNEALEEGKKWDFNASGVGGIFRPIGVLCWFVLFSISIILQILCI